MSVLPDQVSSFKIQEFELANAEITAAVSLAAAAAAAAEKEYGTCNSPEFLDELAAISLDLPTRLIQFMDRVRRDNKTVAAVVRGGWHPELDRLRTPKSWQYARDTKAGNVQNFLQAIYGALLGEATAHKKSTIIPDVTTPSTTQFNMAGRVK